MRRHLIVRAATLLLALLLPVAGVRAGAVACCSDDCDAPCCDRAADHAVLLPVLPCCRTVALAQAAPHPTKATVEQHKQLAATTPALSPPLVVVAGAVRPSMRCARHRPTP